MKRFFCLIIIISVLLFSSCGKSESITDVSQSKTEISATQVNAETEKSISEGKDPIGGGEFTTQKYRLH